MHHADALVLALGMLDRPQSVRLARKIRLPEGMTILLEIAAGKSEAVSRARQLTGRSEANLRRAADFFIEQVLLQAEGDSYRVLGCNRGAPTGELRRNMALIMRWLHPDLTNGSADRLHKSIFVNRVTHAWETIKTEERRTAYDAELAARERKPGRKTSSGGSSESDHKQRRGHAASSNQLRKSFIVKRLEPESFWSRLRLFLGGRR